MPLDVYGGGTLARAFWTVWRFPGGDGDTFGDALALAVRQAARLPALPPAPEPTDTRGDGCEVCGADVAPEEFRLTPDGHPEGPNLLVCPDCFDYDVATDGGGRDCPACGRTSSVLYRCEYCGRDLVDAGGGQA